MVYKNLKFPVVKGRPFFYSNFVQTVDGKVQITRNNRAYWPIGSDTDYATLLDLRSYADVLIHGKHTSEWVRVLDNLAKPAFQAARTKRGKKRPILYIIISGHPNKSVLERLKNPPQGTASLLVTTKNARIPAAFEQLNILKLGNNAVDLTALARYLHQQGHRNVLVEGGPKTFAHFLKADLIDQCFITIAPQIIGNEPGTTLTMVEGHLFLPKTVKKLQLISAKPMGNELFLRYKILR